MDLYAYGQIPLYENLAKDNHIEIPRLRGYRLMSEEEPISIESAIAGIMDRFFYKDFVVGYPAFAINPEWYEYSPRTNRLADKYLTKDGLGLRWDKLHGKKRKNAKYIIKKQKEKILKQMNVYNKYAGQKNVLYIHARIGGYNWLTYGGNKLMTEPWFLEKVDDAIDETYCDIYARIGGAYGFNDVAEWRMDEE